MLIELHIRNFALIDSIDLEFYNGFNVLTGETGAGKSIIIDSVNFILGDKQTKEIIRTGENTAFAEAVFDISDNMRLIELLSQDGIEADDLLIISREINQSGRSISRINGRTVTVSNLKRISTLLIDIHGQHEHQSLLDEAFHIEILDSFCGEDFLNDKIKFGSLYHRLKTIDKELEKLKSDEQEKLRRIDLLRFQIQEISDSKLIIGEDEELKKRKDILVNSEKIFNVLNTCYQNLYEDEEKGSAFDKIGASITGLESIEKYDISITEMSNNLKDVYYKLEDIIEVIRGYKETIEFDENELSEIEFRLDLINRLKRKYGNTVNEIIYYLNNITEELIITEKSDEVINNYHNERNKLLDEIVLLGKKLSNKRIHTAGLLEKNIEGELKYLGMEKAVFQINIENSESIKENGYDIVGFKISTNLGEPPKALIKVASGGEMSRIMLAIKSAIAGVDRISTLIFDEIDTGISGRTAQAVAEKMSLISLKHQLLCVTHLPQIAAMADYHFKIEKVVSGDKTCTNVKKMDEKEKVEELARMLGGAVVTDLTRQHSKEMLELAKNTKIKI